MSKVSGVPHYGRKQVAHYDSGGLVEPGNIDVHKRPIHKNPDGSISTVQTIGITTDRGYVNIPTIDDDGRKMTNDQAIDRYKRTGRHLGIYKDQATGDKAAQALHEQQDEEYGDRR